MGLAYIDQFLRKRPDIDPGKFKTFALKYNKLKVRKIYDLNQDEIDRLVAVWDKSNEKLNEQRNPNKINAPTFAFKTLYDKMPPQQIRGREEHQKQNIKDIPIDKEIPKKAIKELVKIQEIESRSSCQGESELKPTFLIFRTINQDQNYVDKLVNNLNKQKNVKVGYDIGMGGKFRICVTWKIWAGQKGFEEWWKNLPNKINSALEKLR